MFQHSLPLSSPTYENSSVNQNLENEKLYSFQQFKHFDHVEREFTLLSDMKDFHRRKRDTIHHVVNEARGDVYMKAGVSRKTETTNKKVYNFEASASGVASHCDVLVVGGGAVGSSIAYHLKEHAQDGLSVVVVEEDPTVSQILFSLFYLHAILLPHHNVLCQTLFYILLYSISMN